MSENRQNQNVQEHQDKDTSSSSIDYVEALKRPFKDTKKFLIGSLLGMVPIVNLTVIGYTMTSTGYTEEKVKKNNLPEWKNYVDLFKKGLTAAIIGILLFLPAALLLLGTVGTVIMSPALSIMMGGLPIETCESIIAGEITDLQMEDWFAQNWTQFIPLILNATPFLIIGGVLAALAVYLLPAAILSWLHEGRFGAAFSWDVVKMATTLDYLVNWLIVGYLGGLVSTLVGWIPFIGVGITMYVTWVFSYTVFAEIYARGQ